MLMGCGVSSKTGVTLNGNGQTTLTRIIRTVTFEETPEWYKPGIPFEGKVITLTNKSVSLD